MLWLWILLGYMATGMLTTVLYARQEVKTLIADPQKFRYEERSNSWDRTPRKERTEVERVKACGESIFWESWWVGVLWPIALGGLIVLGGYDCVTHLFVGKELKAAKKKDEDKKTAKILKEYEEQQKKDFDNL